MKKRPEDLNCRMPVLRKAMLVCAMLFVTAVLPYDIPTIMKTLKELLIS